MATATADPANMKTGLLDKVGDAFNGMIENSLSFVTRLFGTANERSVKLTGYHRPKGATSHTVVPGSILEKVNRLEAGMKTLSDDDLKGLSIGYRERYKKGETLDQLLPETFAACREAAHRSKGMRHYDTQIVGGAILHKGNIAEMVTGEGKTLVATLPAYLNAIAGEGVHVITVNDYLARRDCEWMLPIYNALGVSAAFIQSDQDNEAKRHAYECDITYGTSSEFGFDYLRDNMKLYKHDASAHPYYKQVQRTPLFFAIIDEVDNILIDEARTPLIISGPAYTDIRNYERSDDIARKLTELERNGRAELKKTRTDLLFQGTEGDGLPVMMPIDPAQVDPQNPPPKGVYFEIKEKERSIHLTDLGVREAERMAEVESFYTAGNMEWPHLIDNALRAHHMFHQDRHYMIAPDPRENNQLGIIIIDEGTGRAMIGRQWSDGLHQSIESKHRKQGVQIKQETQTLATVTLQNFFKLYKKLGGMTGTAMTEANEFWKIYKLDVVAIPTNSPLRRINHPDLVYKSERDKWDAVVEEVVTVNKTGRPMLIGTTDVAKSEMLSALLKKRGVKHELLNAKPENVAREAEIVAQAGRKLAVTISTNMAGRGTDIILGGNPETLAWARLKQLKDADGRQLYPTRLEIHNDIWTKTVEEIEVKETMKVQGREIAEMGGLHIIGTERHESRRVDNQLRGRAGRQGDPGSSRFFVALEDQLMRIFGGERLLRLMNSPLIGMKDGEALESGMLTKQIENAQRRVEEYHFEQRKNLLDYDEVMDTQRKRTYGQRQAILEGQNPRFVLIDMIRGRLEEAVKRYTAIDYGASSFAIYVGNELNTDVTAAHFRGCNADEAINVAKEKAVNASHTFIQESIEENLNVSEDPKDWKWQEMCRSVNSRFGLQTDPQGLKKVGRENLQDALIHEAEKAILATNLDGGRRFLGKDYANESLLDWGRQKFGLKATLEEVDGLEPDQLLELLQKKVVLSYRNKDVDFPVMVGLAMYLPEKSRPDRRPDRDNLFAWATQRFAQDKVELSEEILRTEPKAQVKELLLKASEGLMPTADFSEIVAKNNEIFRGSKTVEADDAKDLVEWCKSNLDVTLEADKLVGKTPDEALQSALNAFDAKYRPEMHQTERSLIIEQLDAAWKAHLLQMDHLRSAVGLRGYGQEDPKIAYKREGMKLFDTMWVGIQERVTESVFRMEDVGDDTVEQAMWAGAQSVQAQATSAMQSRAATMQAQQDAQQMTTNSTASSEPKKSEPIRNNNTMKVGRNEPCPCGSGKKYKNCHMKM